MRIRIRRTPETAAFGAPTYQTEGAAAFDLQAADDGIISPGDTRAVPTGLFMQIPQGYEGQIRARSGLARRHGVDLANGIGTVDSDYRGEILVLLRNLGWTTFRFSRGERIAQMAICPVARAEFEVFDELDETVRGDGGFGSTG